MYSVYLTTFESIDRVGVKLRRSDLDITDTIVIQGPDFELFGFLCRSLTDSSIVRQSILRGSDHLLDINQSRIPAGSQYYEKGGWGKRYNASIMPQMGRHQTRDWVQNRIEKNQAVKDVQPSQNGRFPVNAIFVHRKTCDITKNDDSTTDQTCNRNCRVQQLNHQSGDVGGNTGQSGYGFTSEIYGDYGESEADGYDDQGGSARFHYQAHTLEKALQYLRDLVGHIEFVR
jgi:hypothetical protein